MIDPDFMIHTVSVETYQGSTPTGVSYAAPVDVVGLYDAGLAVVSESGGKELVERSSFYGNNEDAAKFVPKSRVTFQGRISYVENVFMHDGGTVDQFDDVAHIQVILQ